MAHTTIAPGTHVQFSEDGDTGLVLADDDPRIPAAHRPRRSAKYPVPEHADSVYVLYDEPIFSAGGGWLRAASLTPVES